MLRRYYGLQDGTHGAQDEFADEFGRGHTTVGIIVANGAARLLPPLCGLQVQAGQPRRTDDEVEDPLLRRAK